MQEPESKPKKKPSLKEVARFAGVSNSAASVVLNGSTSGSRVSPETRKRVMSAAENLGYVADGFSGTSARFKKTRIGFYSPGYLNCKESFFADLLDGVFQGAVNNGFDVLVLSKPGQSLGIKELVRDRSLCGLVLHVPFGDPITSNLPNVAFPIVSVANTIENFASVTVNDEEGGALLAHHLAARNHKSVLIKQSCGMPLSAKKRTASFCRTAEQLGMKVVTSNMPVNAGVLSSAELLLLAQPELSITAIMCWSDGLAVATCASLELAGYQIPRSVAVVGFNGSEIRKETRFDVTTIVAPWFDVGVKAISNLSSYLDGEEMSQNLVLDVKFHQGTTS